MKEHRNVDWSALHTVEEMRQLSNLGHWIEGGLFGLIGIRNRHCVFTNIWECSYQSWSTL